MLFKYQPFHIVSKTKEMKLEDNTTANTNGTRNTSLLTKEFFLEEHCIFVKCVSVIIGLISLASSILALTVLSRTRKMPKSTTYLVTALLVFDCMFVTFSTVRKFIQEPFLNTSIAVLMMSALQLAYTTVGMMSLERCILFYKPMVYMRLYSTKFIMMVTAAVWISELGIFLCIRYAICYLRFKTIAVFSQAQLCNNLVTIYYSILVTFVLVSSMVCYWIIFVIVQQKNIRTNEGVMSFRSAAHFIKTEYKNTALVLVFWVLILVSSLTYGIIIVLTRYMDLSAYMVRLSLDVVSTLNCLLDPFLYVLWFKECKLELLKIFSCLGQVIKDKAASLHYEVFDIVPYERTSVIRSMPRKFEEKREVDMNNTSRHINLAFYDETTL